MDRQRELFINRYIDDYLTGIRHEGVVYEGEQLLGEWDDINVWYQNNSAVVGETMIVDGKKYLHLIVFRFCNDKLVSVHLQVLD